MGEHPIRLRVEDDLRRSRLTTFFRLLLALPHVVWLSLFTLAALLLATVNWFALLARGRTPETIHAFLAAYVRYSTHLGAYVLLAANPYPGFTGAAGSYPVDVEIAPPARQNRWTVGFRAFLAVPALAVATVLVGGGSEYSGVALTVVVLAWFACLALGRMPLGFRDLQAYALRYGAQTTAYVFLVTDRYPDSDPAEPAPAVPRPPHPIALRVEDDRRRSRLTVFFRLLLALPHLVWLTLWAVAVVVAVIVQWLVALVAGTPSDPLHRFVAAFVRYSTHVSAYLYLVANPFPGFLGRPGSYPVDVELPAPARQHRWVTAFRPVLALPALVVLSALGGLLGSVAFLGWFAALVTGEMPRGFRNAGAYALRYSAQTYGYLGLLTDRYPFSGPPA